MSVEIENSATTGSPEVEMLRKLQLGGTLVDYQKGIEGLVLQALLREYDSLDLEESAIENLKKLARKRAKRKHITLPTETAV